MSNDEAEAFCKSYILYEPVGAVQIAGRAKHTAFNAQRTGDGRFLPCIQRGAAPDRPVLALPPTRAQLRAA